MDEPEWRKSIVSQLHARNKYETAAFKEIINFQSKLFDNVNTLKNENLQLTLQNERIRYSGTESVHGSGGASNEKIQALEQKILAQQEELTSLHRRRGESGQQIINLNAKVHDLEKILVTKDVTISENVALIASLRAEIQLYETNMTELQNLNQMIRDEYQALQITFAALEEKLRKAQDENRALVDRLIKYKSKDADKMNEENENFVKSSPTAFLINTFGRVSFGRKGEKVRKELEEAAREGGSRSSGGSGGSSVDDKILEVSPFYSNAIPTQASLCFDAHEGEVIAVKWSPTDSIVATGGADRKLNIWDISKSGMCEFRGSLIGSNQSVTSIDFDSNGAHVVAGSNDFASRVWSLADKRVKTTLTGHSCKVMAVKFGEPNKIVSGSHDRTLKIWDLKKGMCTGTKFAGSKCNDLVMSDGAGSTIISGHFDKQIRFWDIRSETSANHIQLQGQVTSLDLSRDSNYLLACVRDDTIQLIDLRKTAIVRSFSHDSFKVGCDSSRVAFQPGDNRLAVGGADGGVYIWNTLTGRLEEPVLRKHSYAVTAVSWHPQSTSGLLASVDRGKKCVIWGHL